MTSKQLIRLVAAFSIASGISTGAFPQEPRHAIRRQGKARWLQAGTDIMGINYKGPGDAATDLIGGRLQVTPDSLGSATARIQSGRIKAIGMMAGKRHRAFPDVPTFAELAYTGMSSKDGWRSWHPQAHPWPFFKS